MDRAEHWKRHMAGIRIQPEHFVLHSTPGSDQAPSNAQFVNQCVRVDVIETIAGWDLRRLVPENGCKVRVFTVEVHQVRGKAPLLQHVTRTSEIIYPRTSLL